MNKIGFKKIVLAAGIMLALAFTLNACDGGKSALVGKWDRDDGYSSSFPDYLEFLKDGTGIYDKLGITWKTENGNLYITSPLLAASYDYKVQGSKLTLTNRDNKTLEYKKREK
jgi:hypothetical protein